MAAASSAPSPILCRFLLQLVGILLEDIVTKRLRVEVSEQQHTFYCQELGTLLMCLIHIFKSGRCIALACTPRLRLSGRRNRAAQGKPGSAQWVLENSLRVTTVNLGSSSRFKDSEGQNFRLSLHMTVG